MTNPLLTWVVFNLFVLAMLALDLFVFHRRPHAESIRASIGWSVVWTVLALLFNLGVWWLRGTQPALEFLTGYVVERSLSMDNLFVFVMVFSYFRIDFEYQHKVLFWGVLGALVMRLGFIFAGVALIERFAWVVYVFGAVLVYSGIKMLRHHETQIEPEKNPVLRLFRRLVPVTPTLEGDRFFVVRGGRRFATPLFLVLVLVEVTDLIFAVDSIPAVLAVTRDHFTVYSSNVFAILGMRALYFALAGVMRLFRFLHHGLAGILVFVGVKMLLADVVHVPIAVALGVILATLLAAVAASLRWPARALPDTVSAVVPPTIDSPPGPRP